MFGNRSYHHELLDAENIPKTDLFQNLKELNFINTWLGGHAITIKGMKALIGKSHDAPGHIIALADVGCGGGDNLIAIAKWARKNRINVQLTGIDMKQDCIDFARKNCIDYPEINFITSDYQLVDRKFDIVMCALFCHHLDDQQMIGYLQWAKRSSTIGFFINDLQRHPIAYYSIKYLTMCFSSSYLVKNDAPLSVLRGFHKKELIVLLKKAGIHHFSVNWKWAFRYLIICN